MGILKRGVNRRTEVEDYEPHPWTQPEITEEDRLDHAENQARLAAPHTCAFCETKALPEPRWDGQHVIVKAEVVIMDTFLSETSWAQVVKLALDPIVETNPGDSVRVLASVYGARTVETDLLEDR